MPVGPDYEIVTIRLRKGDRDALRDYFHPVKYNRVIQTLVSRVVDTVRQRGSAGASVEINTENLDV